jgi:acylphosphatase
MIRQHATVRGEVQGVGFRYNAHAVAVKLGVSGFVRNLPDGSVEAEIEGDDTAVGRMVEWLRSGPTWATVSSVEVTDVATTGDSEFLVLE